VRQYTYDAASQINTSGFQYDPQGRLVQSPSHTYQWDAASRLTRIDQAQFTYNGLGQMVRRVQGAQTREYSYQPALHPNASVAEKDGATGTVLRYYVWSNDVAAGNQARYYHFDYLGSTLALSDRQGQLTDLYVYSPYGRLLAHEGNNPQPFTFVGRWGVRMELSGTLYQMGARYYDAESGRFLSREPLWPILGDPIQSNPYQYARSQPSLWIDPFGLAPTDPSEDLYGRMLWAMLKAEAREEERRNRPKFNQGLQNIGLVERFHVAVRRAIQKTPQFQQAKARLKQQAKAEIQQREQRLAAARARVEALREQVFKLPLQTPADRDAARAMLREIRDLKGAMGDMELAMDAAQKELMNANPPLPELPYAWREDYRQMLFPDSSYGSELKYLPRPDSN
jgi:RHS repeat-associated protein